MGSSSRATPQDILDPPIDRRLVVALDMPDVEHALGLVKNLGDSVQFYKFGLELILGGGLPLAQELRDQGKWIFLDMKLLDIGNTVEKAVSNVAKQNFKSLTVHGVDKKTMDAAVQGRGDYPLGLLAVTVLTNLTVTDLREQGIAEQPEPLAVRRAKLAYQCGFNGVIASGHEAGPIRRATADDFIIKTPGIRPSGSDKGDQARVMTPTQAIMNGANYLVVGRPITKAHHPRKVAEDIRQEIAEAYQNLKPLRHKAAR